MYGEVAVRLDSCRWTYSSQCRSWSRSRSSLGQFAGRFRLPECSGGLVLVSAPPSLLHYLLLQVLQTLSDGRTAQLKLKQWEEGSRCVLSPSELKGRGYSTYTHESSKFCDEFVLRHADQTVRRRDGSQLT